MKDRQNSVNNQIRQTVIEHAVAKATSRYIDSREQKIDDFVRRHYSFRGTLRLHSHALGWDILRVPLNILWSIVQLVLVLVALLTRFLRLPRIANAIKKLPPGLKTNMDKHISWLILTELLELPCKQGKRYSDKDALMAEIMADPDLRQLIEDELDQLYKLNTHPDFEADLHRKLEEYSSTRIGSADFISNTLLFITSKFAHGQASFGSLSAGSAISASVAKSIAVSNFWLGSTAGSYYYAIMPVAVSTRLLIAMTALVAVILALISTFIGIITDPVQAKLGLHQRRLRKLVKAIENDLLPNASDEFKLREKYIGRVYDLIDILATISRTP